MSDERRDDPPEDPTDIRFVGPATAASLEEADVDAGDIPRKEVSYRQLVDAGINPGVATKLRREHSLAWSLSGSSGEDLSRRSNQVRGLKDDERAWVAASTGDWESADAPRASGADADGSAEAETAEADGSGEAEAAEAAWRDRSSPDPVTEVTGVTERDAEELAKAGITSVRSLATANPETVADVLGLDIETVDEWRTAAVEQT
jgi:predicted flap endonuclease-1-like 5' DNA nuclease